jgi:mono/diheme cytochrome c family protein
VTARAIAGAFAALLAVLAVASALASDRSAPPATLDDLSLRAPTEFGSTEGDDLRAWMVADAPEVVRAGAEAYASNCAVCHGDTGLGYEEAKLSFPADHRSCTRCHRPGNVREMTFAKMMERQHDLFDVGDPPALRGAGTMTAFAGNDAALFAYLRATMPRYQPGRLSDAEYEALVAFLRWLEAYGG